MPTDVRDLLIDLATDPFRTEEFRNDPHGMMDSAGIDHALRAVLTGGDFKKVEATLTARALMSPQMTVEGKKKKKDKGKDKKK
jgi:hypothetical protein